jgi:hypothetical protein
MAVSLASPSTFRTAKQQATQATVFPAPLRGMDARVPLAADKLDSCIWAINMVPTEYAMRVRRGYRVWQEGLGAEVRSIIPYIGSSQSGVADKLFVATENGIYDCTTQGGVPALKVAFSAQSVDAGHGVYQHYVDESGDDTLFFADGENGLFRYEPTTDTWAQAAGIQAGPTAIGTFDITDVVYITVHKLRIWLVTKDANKAWYLPIRSATGDLTEFFFASKFKHGGDLVGLYNWTVDGGLGRDDHLVAIGRGGDVIPWTGEDPSDVTTWTSTGTFYVGPVPKGRRVASEYGGELFILSKFGISSLTALMQGTNPADPYSNQIGHKIARLLRSDLQTLSGDYGWSVRFSANIGSLIITTPIRDDGRYRQYVYNFSTEGWGLWRDVPLLSSNTWQGELMIGTENGAVGRMDQNRDNIDIDGDGGDPIEWFMLTSFSHLGSPGQFKRAKMVRCNFVAESEPLYEVSTHYDYNTTEPPPPTGAVGPPFGSFWDSGLWGNALWSVSLLNPYYALLGTTGIGRSVAIALVGQSNVETDFVSFDVLWDTGGLL